MTRIAAIFGLVLFELLVGVTPSNAQTPVLDGMRNCVREDRGRPVCEIVATGNYTFVSEAFLARYQSLMRKPPASPAQPQATTPAPSPPAQPAASMPLSIPPVCSAEGGKAISACSQTCAKLCADPVFYNNTPRARD